MGGQPLDYYWSADATEWATDLVFNAGGYLDERFPRLARYGLFIAQSPAVMRFLGRSSTQGRPPDEVVSDLRSRYEGIRLKHWVNCNSIKIYNKDGKSFRAINPWNQEDFKTLQYLTRGENQSNGFRNKHLLETLYDSVKEKTERKRLSAKISRRLRLLRMHGLLQRISRTNRYQLTAKGRKVATAVLAASAANTEQLMKMAA